MKSTLEQHFDQVIRKIFNLSQALALDNIQYGKPANWDSIRHVELFIALQKEFKLSFSSDEIVQLNTYAAIRDSFLEKTKT